MFLVWIGFCGLAIAWNLEQRSLLQRAQEHPFSVSIDEVRDADAHIDFLNRAVLALYAVTAVVFITWLVLEYRRVQQLHGPAHFELHRATWFRPWQVMRVIWKATFGDTMSVAVVNAWWGLFVASTILWPIAANAGDDTRTIEDALRANGFYLGRAVVLLAASAVALLVVHAVLRATKHELPSGAEAEV